MRDQSYISCNTYDVSHITYYALRNSEGWGMETERMINEDQYWQAVLDRDPYAVGAFVYGVRSTGVYCHPTCPSRRPGRGQVVFFATPAAAEEGGFRPCKRCRPA